MSHVFISYSKKNRVYARRLADHLRERGFDVWIDDRLDVGDQWWLVIERAIENCGAFTVVMTPASKASEWVYREVMYALDLKKPVFPLWLDGKNWPLFVGEQYADVRDENLPPDSFYSRLAEYAPCRTQTGADVTEAAPGAAPSEPAFDVHAAITEFYRTRDRGRWVDALDWLVRIRESGDMPRWFDVAQLEHEIQAEIAREEEAERQRHGAEEAERARQEWEAARVREYAILRVMAGHEEDPVRVWAALQMFWEAYGDYDPDGLAEKVRPPDILDVLPPPFEWVDIPAGEVTLITEKGWRKNYVPEEGHKTFLVVRFGLARYCVTNAQFGMFLEADGYGQKRWWTDDGWEARLKGWTWVGSSWKETGTPWVEPRYWRDLKWNGAERPVVGISWYEAVAFCRWLSEQVGYEARLATEQEWQRAAGGDDGRTYVWGEDKPNKELANWNLELGRTTPVSSHPLQAERQPYGLYNMTGNVWEWCATDYDTGSQDIHKKAEVRVLRGGSWSSCTPGDLRVAFRYNWYPFLGYSFIGFRVARSFR
jgi:formylglycine-generating enzyme required for sulfatase activity